MKRKLITLMCLLAVSSCAVNPPNPKADLLFAQNAFLRTVNTLTILREAGKFDEGEVNDIKAVIKTGDSLLDKWTDAVLEGKEFPGVVDVFDTILQDLIEYRKKGEGNV